MTVWRAPERGRREDHDEIDAEALPIDRAQVGDRSGDVAAENVHRDLIAELEAEPVRNAVLERDQRRTLIVRLPPSSFDQARTRWKLVPKGDAAVAVEHPHGVCSGLQVFGGYAVRRHDATTQHRHALERGARGAGADEGVECFGVGGRDIDEVERRGPVRQRRQKLASQIAFDRDHGDHDGEPQAE